MAIVEAITRQLLVKTLQAGKYLACVLVICKVWKLAMACSHESCVKMVNKSNIKTKTPSIVTPIRDNILIPMHFYCRFVYRLLSSVSVTKARVWIGELVYWILTSRNYN
jgi:hypothetical protein